MDRTVAVKLLAPKYTEDPVFRERFLKEAQASARLNHPNIVQAIDVGQADGHYYFVMEFVEGPTLTALLQERHTLPALEACGIIMQIARALEHAHKLGMVHLDIKPGNIMLTATGLAKLADFGLARHVEDVDIVYEQKKIIFGTPSYMSPEQIRGADLDCRSDIYSLGVTFYELVVGSNPFMAPAQKEVLRRVKAGEAVPAHEANPDVPADVSLVISKMMSLDRDKRYTDPAELLTDLEALSRLQPPPVVFNLPRPSAVRARPPRHVITAVVAGASVVLLAAILLALLVVAHGRGYFQPQPPPPPPPPQDSATPDPLLERFQSTRQRAEHLMAEGKFLQARDLYMAFASAHPKTATAEESERAAYRVGMRAEAKAGEIAREVQAALDIGDLAGARAGCDLVAALGFSETDKVALELRERLMKAQAGAARAVEEERSRAAQDAFQALERNIAALLRNERFKDAARLATDFLAVEGYAPFHREVRAELGQLSMLVRVQDAILAGATRVGKLPLPGRPGVHVAGARDGRVVLRGPSGENATSLADLPESTLNALAQRGGVSSTMIHMELAVLLHALGRHAEAVPHFRAASARSNEWFRELERESLLAGAQADVQQGRAREALERLRALKTGHQRTAFYSRHLGEIRDLLDKVRLAAYRGMVAVPAGRFTFQNQSEAVLPLFHIDQHEVTNSEYAAFLDYLSVTGDLTFDHPQQPESKAGHVPLNWNELSKARPNHPVVGVDWYDAFAYAQWRGKRLPTEREWEKGARGADGRKYPWGNAWQDRVANAPPAVAGTSAELPRDVAPVGSFPRSNSPLGCADMAGNAREWVQPESSTSTDNAPTRGGSFMDPIIACSATYRLLMSRQSRDRATGFRCAMDPISDTP